MSKPEATSAAIYKAGSVYYRKLPGKYPNSRHPNPDYDHWILWQPLKLRRFMIFNWWVKNGEPFWLDDEGFHRVM
jgi:hypothetical protein